MRSGAKFTSCFGLSEKQRANKPLMERRRRARINNSLSVLKSIILQDKDSATTEKKATNYNAQCRLEKADILELTVLHLRSLEKQKSTALCPDGGESEPRPSAPSAGVDFQSYRAGYQTCCVDLEHFFEQDQVNPLTKERLLRHLQLRIAHQEASDRKPDPAADVNVSPTRLADGRLAFIVSAPWSWLSIHVDGIPHQSASPLSHSDVIPATPRCSPSDSTHVWRPWF